MEMPPPPPPPPPHYRVAGGAKPDRKTVERNRRNETNALYSRLDALVRAGVMRVAATRTDRLEAAAAYIRRTAERVERLKERKREQTTVRASSPQRGSWSPATEVEVQHLGSGLHAILVTGAPPSDGASSFHRAVRAVEEAGGEVQTAHFSVVGARAIYTIHTLGGIESVLQRLEGIESVLRGDA